MSDATLADHARRFQALRDLAAYIRANAQFPLDPETVADIIEHQATFVTGGNPDAKQGMPAEPPGDDDDTNPVTLPTQDEMDAP